VHKGLYRLKEDVTFEPNPTANYFPICAAGATQQAEYCDTTTNLPLVEYAKGFFAAVTMQGTDILLDLNEKTLKSSEKFLLYQRQYVNVELGDQSMLMTGETETANTADDSMTGNALNSCENCSVYNGTLGRSLQAGIHGINNSYILLKDLTIQNFEMAGISAAGLQYGVVKNVNVTAIESVALNAHYS